MSGTSQAPSLQYLCCKFGVETFYIQRSNYIFHLTVYCAFNLIYCCVKTTSFIEREITNGPRYVELMF